MSTHDESDPHRRFESMLQSADASSARVHMLGIGGVGMAGVAVQLGMRGLQVSGCDEQPGPLAEALRERGIQVESAHDAGHLENVDWVVRSTAVPDACAEIAAAKSRGIPVLQRGWVLSRLLHGLTSVVVTGTHGKTTTTGFITQALRSCGGDPSFCIGGIVDGLGGVAHRGSDGVIVVEGDESDGTIRHYAPDVCVVTNIDFDHMEHFEDEESFVQCFREVCEQTRRRIVFCGDDPRAFAICAGDERALSYGTGEGADVRAVGMEQDGEGVRFRIVHAAKELGPVSLACGGIHNVRNATAAVAVSIALDHDAGRACDAIPMLELPRRRLETVASVDGVRVLSDYAHHPTEVRACVETVRSWHHGRLLAVYQPHRFTRTKALGPDFPAAFEGVDHLLLLPVYAASEPEIPGGRTLDLYRRFRDSSEVCVHYAAALGEAWHFLRTELRPGDLLLVMGAGDVDRIAGWAKEELAHQGLGGLDPSVSAAAELSGLVSADTRICVGEPLGSRTTWKVGGRADIRADIGCGDDLAALLRWCSENEVAVHMLGAGSNLLVSDLGVRGVVIRLVAEAFRNVSESDGLVIAGAGTSNRKALSWVQERGWSGLEFLEGVPGTIGGAIRMNAGAWGGETGTRVESVRGLTPDGRERTFDAGDLVFGYRGCETLADIVVLEASFRLEKSTPEQVREQRRVLAEKRSWWKEVHSAGSVFRNPAGASAGCLLEESGMKGLQIGGARFYERHANVIATDPGATASDVLALIATARDRVREHCGVDLQAEIKVLGVEDHA